MKKIATILGFILIFSGCKDEAVKKPDRLIEKEVMKNIIYDLSLLDAIKFSDPSSLEKYKVSPKEYIYKKYKIDSLQFAHSNQYYAINYEEYKDMFDQVAKRIDGKKVVVDSLLKIQKKQDSIKEAKKRKLDSISKLTKKPLSKKDSLDLVKKKALQKKDSILKAKKKIRAMKKTPVQK